MSFRSLGSGTPDCAQGTPKVCRRPCTVTQWSPARFAAVRRRREGGPPVPQWSGGHHVVRARRDALRLLGENARERLRDRHVALGGRGLEAPARALAYDDAPLGEPHVLPSKALRLADSESGVEQGRV